MSSHPSSANDVDAKRDELDGAWMNLKDQAAARKHKLLDSYDLHRFLNDFRSVEIHCNVFVLLDRF